MLLDNRVLGVLSLIAGLKDKNLAVRKAAAKALGNIGDHRAVEPLIAALGDAKADVREAAAEALGAIGDLSASDRAPALLGSMTFLHSMTRAPNSTSIRPDPSPVGFSSCGDSPERKAPSSRRAFTSDWMSASVRVGDATASFFKRGRRPLTERYVALVPELNADRGKWWSIDSSARYRRRTSRLSP